MKNSIIFSTVCAAIAVLLGSCASQQMNTVRVNERPYTRHVSAATEQPTGTEYTDPSVLTTQSTDSTDPSSFANSGVGAVPSLPSNTSQAAASGYISGANQTIVPSPASNFSPTTGSASGKYPVATQVPGDPNRVYSPSDPSKTVKIVDKFGNRQPSGKKLYDPYAPAGTKVIFLVP